MLRDLTRAATVPPMCNYGTTNYSRYCTFSYECSDKVLYSMHFINQSCWYFHSGMILLMGTCTRGYVHNWLPTHYIWNYGHSRVPTKSVMWWTPIRLPELLLSLQTQSYARTFSCVTRYNILYASTQCNQVTEILKRTVFTKRFYIRGILGETYPYQIDSC